MTAPMTREDMADWLSDYATCIVDDERCGRKLLEIVAILRAGVAQTAVTSGTLTFGALVENIAASDRNPIKRGIFIRKTSAMMAEYATKEGCHSTPLDNLRASNQGASK